MLLAYKCTLLALLALHALFTSCYHTCTCSCYSLMSCDVCQLYSWFSMSHLLLLTPPLFTPLYCSFCLVSPTTLSLFLLTSFSLFSPPSSLLPLLSSFSLSFYPVSPFLPFFFFFHPIPSFSPLLLSPSCSPFPYLSLTEQYQLPSPGVSEEHSSRLELGYREPKHMDPGKARQAERLGMGVGRIG